MLELHRRDLRGHAGGLVMSQLPRGLLPERNRGHVVQALPGPLFLEGWKFFLSMQCGLRWAKRGLVSGMWGRQVQKVSGGRWLY